MKLFLNLMTWHVRKLEKNKGWFQLSTEDSCYKQNTLSHHDNINDKNHDCVPRKYSSNSLTQSSLEWQFKTSCYQNFCILHCMYKMVACIRSSYQTNLYQSIPGGHSNITVHICVSKQTLEKGTFFTGRHITSMMF